MASRFARRAALALSLAAAFTAPGIAADVTWDITPGTVGAGDSAITGGLGAWNTTNGNWTIDDGVNNIAWINANNDTAIFGGTAGTVTLGTTITAGGLTFNSSGYIVTGSTLTLGGVAPAVTVTNTADTATISSIIAGGAGFTKSGTGTLILGADNTYSGGTTVSAGTLRFTNVNQLEGATFIDAGATLNFAPTAINQTLANVFTGTGTIKYDFLAGGGTGNSFITNINGFAGTLELTSSAATGDKLNVSGWNAPNLAVIVGNNTQFFPNATASTIKSLSLIGTGNTEARGALRLTTALTVTDGVELQGNTTIGGEGGTINGGITSAVNSTLTVGTAASGGNATLNGVIADGAGVTTLVKAAAGTLTLVSNNTYSGATSITGGTLQLGNGGSTGSLGTDTGAIANAGVLAVNRNNAYSIANAITGAGGFTQLGTGTTTLSAAGNTYTGATTVSAGTLVITNAAGNASASYAIAANGTLEFDVDDTVTRNMPTSSITGAGTFRKTGLGSLNWPATAGTFAMSSGGLIDVQGGILTGGSSANEVWTNNLSDLNVASGATFRGVEANVRVDVMTGGGTIQSGYTGSGYVNFTFGVDNGSGVFNGVLANSVNAGNFVKAGTGSQTLAGVNTYTGTTTINSGVLSLAGNGSLLTTTAQTLAGGTFRLDNSTTNSGNRLSDTVAIAISGGATFDFTHNAAALTSYSETAGALQITGATTVTVSSAQAEAGQTSTLTFASLTRTSGFINFAGAGLGVDPRNTIKFTTAPTLTGGIIGPWASYNGSGLAGYDATLGVIEYAGYTDIAARGPGSVIPDDATVNARINSAGTSGPITVAGATTSAVNTILQNTTTAASIDLTGKTLSVSGLLIGAGQESLTIGTAANAGTIRAATAGGELFLSNASTNPLTINAAIANNTSASTTTVMGGGTTVLTGTNTYTGVTTIISSSTLQLGNGLTGNDGTLASAVTNNGTLVFNRFGTPASMTAIISGPGNVIKLGPGTQTLGGANLFTGGVAINEGTLAASVAGALGTGQTNVASGAKLALTGAGVTYTSAGLNGAGTVDITLGTGGATTSFNGSTGAFTGTLNIGVGASPGAGKVQITATSFNTVGAATTINVLQHGTAFVTVSRTANFVLNGGDTGETLGQLRLENGITVAGTVKLAGAISSANDTHIGTNTTAAGTVSAIVSDLIPASPVTFVVGGGTTGGIVFSGANTYAGPTLLRSGFMRAGVATVPGVSGAFGVDSAITLSNVANATMDLNGFATRIGSLAGGGTTGGNVTLGAAVLTTGANNTSTSFGGIISSTTAGNGLIKIGTGTQTLTGASTFNGATTLTGGGITLSGTAGALTATSGLAIGLGTTFQIDNTTTNNSNRVNNTATVALNGGTFDFKHNGTAATNYAETVAALTITGKATVSASQGADAVTGTSTLTFASLGGTGTINFVGTGLGVDARNAIKFTTNPTLANGLIGPWATYNGSGFASYDATLGVTEYTGYTDVDTQAFVITSSAASNVRINTINGSGNNTLSGLTTNAINTLTQNTTGASTLDTAGKTLSIAGIVINPSMAALTIGATVGSGTINAATAGGSLYLGNSGTGTLTVNAVIANNTSASSLLVGGTGTTRLTGISTYTGATNLSSGTLSVDYDAGNINTTSGITVAPGATLNINRDNNDITFNRNLSGSGTVIFDLSSNGLVGTRLLTISGANSGFSGTLKLSPTGLGTFRTANTTAQANVGTGTIDIDNGAQLWPTGNFTNNLLLTGSGFTEVAGGTTNADLVTISGLSSSSGIGAIRGANNTFSGNVTLQGSAKVQAYGSSMTFSGTLSNTASTDVFVLGGGGSGSTTVITGDATQLERIWVNSGGSTGTNLLQIGNDGTTGTLGSGEVTLHADAVAAASLDFRRSNGYTLVAGQNIMAHTGAGGVPVSANYVRANVFVNGGGLSVGTGGANTIDLSDGTNGGSLFVGNATTGATLTIGSGATIDVGIFGAGEAANMGGTIAQTGGAVTVSNYTRLGSYPTETATYNMSGGTLAINRASTATNPSTSGATEQDGGIYVGIDGRGIFNQSGGTVSTNFVVLDNRTDTLAGTNMASSLDQYNLSGGTLNLKSTYGIIQRNSGEVNFSGGTIRVDNSGTGTGTGANLAIPLDTALTVTGTTATLDTVNSGNSFVLNRNVGGAGTLTVIGGGGLTLNPGASAQAISPAIAGSGFAVTKLGTGTTTLSGSNTYTGTTTVNAGTLAVTGSLTNNGPVGILLATPDSTFLDNPIITRRVGSGASYTLGSATGLGSTAVSSDPDALNTSMNTTASILAGTASGQTDVSMQWRARTADEANTNNNPNAVLSNVLNLSGVYDTGGGVTDVFLLEMSYTDSALGSLNEAAIALSGELRLGWLNGGTWTTAVDGNSTPTSNFVGIMTAADFLATPGTLASKLGSYGVDPASNKVWAVLDHNSQFAVIPEPSTLVVGGLALLGFAGVGLRRRRFAKQQAS